MLCRGEATGVRNKGNARAVRQRVGWRGSIQLLDMQKPVVICPPVSPSAAALCLLSRDYPSLMQDWSC